jgi:hypothetical protein
VPANPFRSTVAYLIVQAILVTAWWLILGVLPDARDWFRPPGVPDFMLLAFWVADLVCIIVTSLLAAWLVHRRDPRRVVALSFASGALVYGTLYCATLTWLTGQAWLGVILMIPATVVTLAITRAETR